MPSGARPGGMPPQPPGRRSQAPSHGPAPTPGSWLVLPARCILRLRITALAGRACTTVRGRSAGDADSHRVEVRALADDLANGPAEWLAPHVHVRARGAGLSCNRRDG